MQPALTLPLLLTERQAAELLHVSVDTLRRLRKYRTIGYYKIGRRIRYTEENISVYINKQKVDPCERTARNDPVNSATTGSVAAKTAMRGVELGSIRELDRLAEYQSASRILKKQS